MNQSVSSPWTLQDAKELYGIDSWSKGYFDVSAQGEVTVQLQGKADQPTPIRLTEIVEGVRDRGRDLPVLLRFGELLESRIRMLNDSFQNAIDEVEYGGKYHGVYPIKVNQQQQVLDSVTTYGHPYNYGLEAGSKPELVAAVAYLHDTNAYLVCNGYKDSEFIDLALRAQKMGLKVVLVVEMPSEVDTILERATLLGIDPILGIRVRLAAKSCGHWHHSAGDKSVFGLHMTQLMAVVDRLRDLGKLNSLRMLHFHQGSQIPNIRAIREAVLEAARIYVDLVSEGAPMGLIDLGGGLAVDYEGIHSSGSSSANYGINEYCVDIVDVIKRITDEAGIPNPDIISESGRAVVAYYSVLIFDIVDVNGFFPNGQPEKIPENAPGIIADFYEVWDVLTEKNLQECFNDAIFYRDQLHQMHVQGNISLRERSLGEHMFAHLMKRFAAMIESVDQVPEEMKELEELGVDFYYGNFSLFQSLPDAWAINQVFPVVPLHRLLEQPTRKAVLADITCDCDGRLDRFIGPNGAQNALPVHELREKDDYLIGVFLVGAYQETLGGLHNLIGDTNIVSVELDDEGRLRYTHEVDGDAVGEVLTYVEYDLKDLRLRFRRFAEEAVEQGRITPKERRSFTDAYEEGLRGYTYFRS